MGLRVREASRSVESRGFETALRTARLSAKERAGNAVDHHWRCCGWMLARRPCRCRRRGQSTCRGSALRINLFFLIVADARLSWTAPFPLVQHAYVADRHKCAGKGSIEAPAKPLSGRNQCHWKHVNQM